MYGLRLNSSWSDSSEERHSSSQDLLKQRKAYKSHYLGLNTVPIKTMVTSNLVGGGLRVLLIDF